MKNKLPNDWKIVELREIIYFEKKSKRKAGEGQQSGKYKFFTSSPIQSKFLNEYDFNSENLIMGSGGSASVHYCNNRFSCSTDCFIIRVDKRAYAKYVYYFLSGNMHLIESGFQGAGLRHISKKYIEKIKIPLPPLETQKQIVGILERAERVKEKRKRANELSKNYIKSVFYDIFGNPTKNEKKWDIKPLKEFGEIKTGNTPPRIKKEYYGKYIEWIKSDNLNNPDTYLTEAEEWLSEAGSKVGRIVSKRSVLVTCIAGSPSCIGNAGITNRDVAFNQQINAITPRDEVNELFLYYLIIYSKNYMLNFSTQSMKGMISKGTFEQIPFIYPPKDIQYKFGKIANHIERIKNKQKQSEEKINNLYNSTIQRAFNGELIK